jgi:hypothetical protein
MPKVAVKPKVMRGYLNEAEDIGSLLEYEAGFAKCGLAHDNTGLPPFQVLFHLWGRARNLYERYMNTLPQGQEREEIADFLAERDERMARLKEKARAMLEKVEGEEARDG